MSKHQASKQAIPGKLRSLFDRAEKAGTRYEATHNLADLDQALALYNQIIQHPTFAQTPKEFQAKVQWNTAFALDDHFERMGDSSNLEQAILYYKQALEVFTRQANPGNWAMTMGNLGNAYRNHIRGDTAENLEQAILYYNQAHEVYTRQANPGNWAMTMNNLGLAYDNRIRGDKAENLEQAVKCYTEALEVFTRQADPGNWAMTMINLGVAYVKRIRGDAAENLEQAIKCYTEALEVFTRQADPGNWAMTMVNLGLAYDNRIRGDKAENLEQAVKCYTEALEVFTRQADPGNWAMTMINLGNAYQERIRGDTAENLEQAIKCYEQALEVFTRQANPGNWATTMINLGLAYSNRIRGDTAENLEQAIKCLEQALEVFTRQAIWALTMMNLGNAYQDRIRGDTAENLEQAIKCYEQAQEVFTRQANPGQWAKTMINLGSAYVKRILGDAAENLEQAIKCYEQALEILTPTSHPQKCLDTASYLGYRLYRMGRFSEARKYLEIAHQAIQQLREEIKRYERRKELSEGTVAVYAQLVFCCLHGGDEVAALNYTMAGKGRAFVDLLAHTPEDFQTLLSRDPKLEQAAQPYLALRQEVDTLLLELTRAGNAEPQPLEVPLSAAAEEERATQQAAKWNQLAQLQSALSSQWEALSQAYPLLTSTASAPALDLPKAQTLAGTVGATLVEYYQHAEGWGAFVITPTTFHYIPLAKLTEEQLAEMLKWLEDLKDPNARSPYSMEGALYPWYEAIFAPLAPYIPVTAPVILAPHGSLHLLPLAVARHELDEYDPPKNPYLLEEYTLAFAPSLSALWVVQQQAQKAQQKVVQPVAQILTVAYPGADPQDRFYLEGVVPEAEAVGLLFPAAKVEQLHEAKAQTKAVIKAAKGRNLVHIGCHGDFDASQPDASGLALADGHLTVRDIVRELRLEEAQLVTLAACQSGQLSPSLANEGTGLIQAMLTAGTPVVIASLWSVDDAATKVLFGAFYQGLSEGQAVAVALREAAKEVRVQKGAHPFYWGAFQANGLALVAQQEGLRFPVVKPLVEAGGANIARKGFKGQTMDNLVERAERLLEQLGRDKPVVKLLREKGEGAIFLGRLDQLIEQVSSVNEYAELLAVASEIQRMFEEVTALRERFIPIGLDVAEVRAVRENSLKVILATKAAAPSAEYVAERKPEIENSLKGRRARFKALLEGEGK